MRWPCLIVAGLLLSAVNALAADIPVTLADENGVPVPGAQVALLDASAKTVAHCESDFAGRCHLTVAAGTYTLTVSRTGFYQLKKSDASATAPLELVLTHVQEVKETVNVVESVPAVDPQQTADTRTLDAKEIINVPYPTTRDIRNLLPMIPGVVRGPFGEAHVGGAETYETEYLLDDFNISQAATGFLQLRFSADAVRAVDVESSRYSAQYGPASGGIIAFRSNMADDHYRFSATNFVPSAQMKNGLHFDKFVPRATFSGPIVKGRAWFLLAPEFEYDNNVVPDLPGGANRNPVWRGSNLLKLQFNPTRQDVLTGSVLVNFRRSTYDALSLLNPLSATTNNRYFAHLLDLREQHMFAGGVMLEAGVAASSFLNHSIPQGTQPYQITPNGVNGNFFEDFRTDAARTEGILNLYLPPIRHHQVQLGAEAQRLTYDNRVTRNPIEILGADGSLQSRTSFSGAPTYGLSNAQLSAYVQDRWSPLEKLIVEGGVRITRDHLAQSAFAEPRVAGTLMLSAKTKLSAGAGLLHDVVNMELISRAYAGSRTTAFACGPAAPGCAPPATTTFTLDRNDIRSPAFINYSVAVERELPWTTTLQAEYMVRDGRNALTYVNLSSDPFVGQYLLQNTRRDRYHSFLVTARHRLKNDHEIMVSYQRSAAHSNSVLDFTLDNPFFSRQQAGPLPWDTPNRFLSWGWLPVPKTKRWDMAYTLDWHTGIPFSVVGPNQEIVGAANSYRFPDFFSLDYFLEWRFGAIGRNWALRGGFENITGHRNPGIVFNNTTSPNFLKFSQFEGRAFTVRIRFLGRK